MTAMRAWIKAHAREIQFFGGLFLVGAAPLRWAIVGAVLVLHVVLGPLLVRRGG